MANVKISELAASDVLDGTELVEIVQGGTNVQTTTQDIADLVGGGVTVSVKTADFDADTSGTVYTNTGAGGVINATLQDLAVNSQVTLTPDPDEGIYMTMSTVPGITATVYDVGAQTITDAVYGYVATGGSVTFTKITATVWQATAQVGEIGLD